MGHGYFKVYRQLFDNPIWTEEPFTRGQAWIDLLGKANHKDSWMFVRGIKVDILRGETCRAEDTLAKDWKWSRGKVRRFLKLLETESMIERKQNNRIGIISICNYSAYQDAEKINGTTNSTIESRQTDDKQYPNKNVKNVKKKERTEEVVFHNKVVIDFFNKVCGTNYTYKNKEVNGLISGRLKEGFDVEDFKIVINKKFEHWKNDERMKQHITPTTLFRPSNFEKYLNQIGCDQNETHKSPTMTAIPGSVYV